MSGGCRLRRRHQVEVGPSNLGGSVIFVLGQESRSGIDRHQVDEGQGLGRGHQAARRCDRRTGDGESPRDWQDSASRDVSVCTLLVQMPGPKSQCRHTGLSLIRAFHALEISMRQPQGIPLCCSQSRTSTLLVQLSNTKLTFEEKSMNQNFFLLLDPVGSSTAHAATSSR